jgi:hypothetical protein
MQYFISYCLSLDFPLGLNLKIFYFQKVIIYENGNKSIKYNSHLWLGEQNELSDSAGNMYYVMLDLRILHDTDLSLTALHLI